MSDPTASVVVPAHDEEDSIGATLDALLADARLGEFEVVVVCNGCRDATAEVASRRPRVQVETLDESSKIAALRRGDEVATAFPRIYLDGDVVLDTAAARALVAALATDEPRAAGIVGRLDTSGSTVLARWYFDFRQLLPVFQRGIIGAGVYAMNRAGRERFGSWPDVTGDDQFVLRTFHDDERILVPGHRTTVAIATDLRSVVRRQFRVRRGNRELTTGRADQAAMPAPSAGVGRALRSAVASPSRWPSAAVWLGVNLYVRARLRMGSAAGDWTAAS